MIHWWHLQSKMGFGALRALIRPVSRNLPSRPSPASCLVASSLPGKPLLRSVSEGSIYASLPWVSMASHLHSLTDTRLPKRRPQLNPCRRRATLRPPGPYAWVRYTPGEPILPNNPNEGSVKQRNLKKRRRLHRAFVLAERKKRKAELQEAKKKKKSQQVERKMAAMARERAWADRLTELQRLDEEKKMAVS